MRSAQALSGIATVVFALASVVHADMLRNGAFHDGADGAPAEWRSEAWTRDGVEFSWTPQTSDAPSNASIHNLVPNDTRWCQMVAVQPGATYRVSARVRTSDVGTSAAGAHIVIERVADSTDVRGTAAWRRLDVESRAGEERQWDVCLRLGSYAQLNTGTAWFTDVSMAQIGAPATAATPESMRRLLAWARASGFQATLLPLVGGALLAFGLGIGRRRRAL